jgi:hypothetical protein
MVRPSTFPERDTPLSACQRDANPEAIPRKRSRAPWRKRFPRCPPTHYIKTSK